ASPAVCFRPDGASLAQVVGNGDVRVRAWGGQGASFEVKGTGPARSLAFGGGGRLLAVGWADHRVTIHDGGSGVQQHEITGGGVGFGEVPVALSPDGPTSPPPHRGSRSNCTPWAGRSPTRFLWAGILMSSAP